MSIDSGLDKHHMLVDNEDKMLYLEKRLQMLSLSDEDIFTTTCDRVASWIVHDRKCERDQTVWRTKRSALMCELKAVQTSLEQLRAEVRSIIR